VQVIHSFVLLQDPVFCCTVVNIRITQVSYSINCKTLNIPFNTFSGFYMYIEASYGNKGDVAVLSSPELNMTGPACLSLFYHMKGQHIGKLRISLADSSNASAKSKDIFTLAGEQGNGWRQLYLNIQKSTPKSHILFTAVRGGGYQGDIAIDDIIVEAGLCASLGKTYCHKHCIVIVAYFMYRIMNIVMKYKSDCGLFSVFLIFRL